MNMKPYSSMRCCSQNDNPDKLYHVNTNLQQQLRKLLPADGDYSLVSGLLRATRRDRLNEAGDTIEWPRIGIVVQGGKCMEDLGRQFHCNESTCFVNDSGEYGLSYVTKVPYLSLSLGLDKHLIRRLMVEGKPFRRPRVFSPNEAMGIADLGIVAAFSRLISLVERPEQARFLAPLIIKEIHYRVLIGPLGEKVRVLASGKPKNCSCGYALDRALAWFSRLF